MFPVLLADIWHGLAMFLLSVTSVFLILVVLVQRGRGGGLAGALGGMGGQSAFGTKAGDLFTRVTVVIAAVWILLCVAVILMLGQTRSRFGETPNQPTLTAPAGAGATKDGAKGGAAATPSPTGDGQAAPATGTGGTGTATDTAPATTSGAEPGAETAPASGDNP